MEGDSLEPAAETSRWIISEHAHFLRQFHQNVLGEIFGISVGQIPLATPTVDVSAVPFDELGPTQFVGWLMTQLGQQRDMGRWQCCSSHKVLLPARRKSSAKNVLDSFTGELINRRTNN